MAAQLKGPWDQGQINGFLQETRFPLRLACMGGDGFPRVVSIWYGYDGDVFHCVSHRSSQLVRLLEKSPKVGFEIGPNEPPYYGVRGQGEATLTPDEHGRVLRQMLQRYLDGEESSLAQWLLSRADGEMLITIRPLRLFSWDYRDRMS